MLLKLLLVLLYPLLLVRRFVLLMSGRDPMNRREPPGSCWVPREVDPAARTYYSEASDQEAGDTAPAAALRYLSRAWTPMAGARDATRHPSAEPADIPDEVYTLW